MAWVTFTASDVQARLYDSDLEAYDSVSGAAKLAEIVTQTLAKFRGAIRSNPQVTSMGAAGTLPDFVIFDAAIIARTALIGLSPVVEGVTDPRSDEYNAAMKTLGNLSTMNPKAFDDDPSEFASASASYGGAPILDF